MKHLTALALGCFLMAGAAFAGQPVEADYKWLEVVAKMVDKGQTELSTPIEERVTLLKEWAGKNGYIAQVKKAENTFRIELSKGKGLAQK